MIPGLCEFWRHMKEVISGHDQHGVQAEEEHPFGVNVRLSPLAQLGRDIRRNEAVRESWSHGENDKDAPGKRDRATNGSNHFLERCKIAMNESLDDERIEAASAADSLVVAPITIDPAMTMRAFLSDRSACRRVLMELCSDL